MKIKVFVDIQIKTYNLIMTDLLNKINEFQNNNIEQKTIIQHKKIYDETENEICDEYYFITNKFNPNDRLKYFMLYKKLENMTPIDIFCSIFEKDLYCYIILLLSVRNNFKNFEKYLKHINMHSNAIDKICIHIVMKCDNLDVIKSIVDKCPYYVDLMMKCAIEYNKNLDVIRFLCDKTLNNIILSVKNTTNILWLALKNNRDVFNYLLNIVDNDLFDIKSFDYLFQDKSDTLTDIIKNSTSNDAIEFIQKKSNYKNGFQDCIEYCNVIGMKYYYKESRLLPTNIEIGKFGFNCKGLRWWIKTCGKDFDFNSVIHLLNKKYLYPCDHIKELFSKITSKTNISCVNICCFPELLQQSQYSTAYEVLIDILNSKRYYYAKSLIDHYQLTFTIKDIFTTFNSSTHLMTMIESNLSDISEKDIQYIQNNNIYNVFLKNGWITKKEEKGEYDKIYDFMMCNLPYGNVITEKMFNEMPYEMLANLFDNHMRINIKNDKKETKIINPMYEIKIAEYDETTFGPVFIFQGKKYWGNIERVKHYCPLLESDKLSELSIKNIISPSTIKLYLTLIEQGSIDLLSKTSFKQLIELLELIHKYPLKICSLEDIEDYFILNLKYEHINDTLIQVCDDLQLRRLRLAISKLKYSNVWELNVS